MKNSSMTLLSLLTSTIVVFAEPATVAGPIQQGIYQFAQSDQIREYKLCTYEMCQLTPEGAHVTKRTSVVTVQGAIALASDTDAENYIVFYPPGKEGDENARRVLRKRYLVELKPGASLEEVRERCGIHKMEPLAPGSKFLVCEEESSGKVLKQLDIVANDHGVERVEPLLASPLKKHEIPTDRFFGVRAPADPLVQADPVPRDSYQWYLKKEERVPYEDGSQDDDGSYFTDEYTAGIARVDINVAGAWDQQQITGDGVVIGIVDDGVLVSDGVVAGSPDLDPNASLELQWPENSAILGASFNDTHGTEVAGLACAVRDDEFGMVGAAYGANFASIRLLGEGQLVDDVQIANALRWKEDEIHIYNNSWGRDVSGAVLVQESDSVMEALKNGVTSGRDNKGSIYVFSAGNDAANEDNSNFSSLTSSQYTIAVGAVTNIGRAAPFSEPGANLIVSAPSGGGSQSILTTTYVPGLDEDGNIIRVPTHFDSINGTSASAPLVSGVVALMLEANPSLGWRDVQDILIQTAEKINPDDPGWYTNGAGLHFHHNYGAGLVNAEEAVNEAAERINNLLPSRYTPPGTPPAEAVSTPSVEQLSFDGQKVIPEGQSIQRVFDLSKDPDTGVDLPMIKTEHVELRLRVFTERKGDLEVVLISPSGTRSVLSPSQENNDDEEGILNYVFMTARNWGEGSAGEWTLSIADVNINGIEATYNDATLKVYGVQDESLVIKPGPVLIGPRTFFADLGESVNYAIETLGEPDVTVGALPSGLVYNEAESSITGVPQEPGIFSFQITLTTDVGQSSVTEITVIVRPISAALGDAVNLTIYEEEANLLSFSGGDIPWTLETGRTLDQEAARSGVGLLDDQDSVLGFNGLPAGVIQFNWAVSSQSYSDENISPATGEPISPNDRLWFNFGGNVPQSWSAFIDGERQIGSEDIPRGIVAVQMPASLNNPRWIYRKDNLFSDGEDAGYLDQVKVFDTESFMDRVRSWGNIEGLDVEFPGKTMWVPIKLNGQIELLRTSSVGNGQTVSMSAWVEGPGTLKFRCAVSSEPETPENPATQTEQKDGDVFEFLVDGAPREIREGRSALSGSVGFADTSHSLPEGLHYIEFRYRKDFTGFEGQDWVLLKDVSFTPTGTAASMAARFGVHPSDMDKDYDGDGYTTHEEMIFGGDPNVRDIPSNLPKFVKDGSGSFLEFGVNLELGDVTITAQHSPDLESWEDADNAVMDRREGNVEFYRIPVEPSAADNHLYYRVIAKPKS